MEEAASEQDKQTGSNDEPFQEDVDSIRQILFGEQARQTAERFEMLEGAISTLRRENMQLRQLLEVEISGREKAYQKLKQWADQQNQQQNQQYDQQLSDLQRVTQEQFDALHQGLTQNRQAQTQMIQAVIDTIGGYKNTLAE
jgi:cell division protein FtsX